MGPLEAKEEALLQDVLGMGIDGYLRMRADNRIADVLLELKSSLTAATARAEAAEADAEKCRAEYRTLYSQVSAVMRERDELATQKEEFEIRQNWVARMQALAHEMGWCRNVSGEPMAAFFERVFTEAQAHAAELRGALEEAAGRAYSPFEPDNQARHYTRWKALLSRTPAQSLARVKAEALRELESLVTKSHDSGEVVFWSNMDAEADRLEKECGDAQA